MERRLGVVYFNFLKNRRIDGSMAGLIFFFLMSVLKNENVHSSGGDQSMDARAVEIVELVGR